MYRSEFSILNETTNRWIGGVTEQNFKWNQFLFAIRWNGHQINMNRKEGESPCRFRDESGELLADFRLQLTPAFWLKKYDVKVYINKYPEEIYLLALAAYDGEMASVKKG